MTSIWKSSSTRRKKMAKKFKALEAKMSPESRTRVKARVDKLIAEMPLDELREARQLTQEHLAQLLRVKQPSVSRMERRVDMYLSTLQTIVKAMGGELEIIARFPEGIVKINQ